MNYTENYQLNQWEESDRVLMEDFNADNQKIETALGKKCEIVCGTYTGDAARERKIELGFTPKAVLVVNEEGYMRNGGTVYGGLALAGHPALSTRDRLPAVAVTDGGFLVYYEYSQYGTIHSNSGINHYIAIG